MLVGWNWKGLLRNRLPLGTHISKPKGSRLFFLKKKSLQMLISQVRFQSVPYIPDYREVLPVKKSAWKDNVRRGGQSRVPMPDAEFWHLPPLQICTKLLDHFTPVFSSVKQEYHLPQRIAWAKRQWSDTNISRGEGLKGLLHTESWGYEVIQPTSKKQFGLIQENEIYIP